MTQEYYLGIDWSEKRHDICIRNGKGEIVVEKSIAHSVKGFEELEVLRQVLQVSPWEIIVGIETANSLIIDWLWEKRYEHLYVIPPGTVDKSRKRFHVSGAKDDRMDAREISDLIRLERSRLLPWHPGTVLLQRLRAEVSFSLHLTKLSVMESNRLRSLLLRYYPAAFYLCESWPTLFACHLVSHYPHPQQVRSLSFVQFREFALRHGYPNPKELLACFDRLQASYPPATEAISQALAPQAQSLAEMLLNCLRKKEENQRQLTLDFNQHPDSALFSSFPGAGKLLAPALLVKFGEQRSRFPTAQLVQTLAGTCPVTDQSGKHKDIYFRKACDHEFRHIAQQWAQHSRVKSIWAQGYYNDLLKRLHAKQHATRCLANRLLAIAWRCWQDGSLYDESFHLQRRAQRRLSK